jgi:hypothetical protein
MSSSAHAKAAEPRIVEVYSSTQMEVDAKKTNDTTKHSEEDVKNDDDFNITKAGGEDLHIIEDDKQKAEEEAARKAEEERTKIEAEERERKEKINGKVMLKYNMYAEEVTLCDPRMIH